MVGRLGEASCIETGPASVLMDFSENVNDHRASLACETIDCHRTHVTSW